MAESAHAEEPAVKYKSYKEIRETTRETETDAKVLRAIWDAWRQGHVPTLRFLGKEAGIKTTSHTRYILKKLATAVPPKIVVMQHRDGGVLTVWPAELWEGVAKIIKEIDDEPRQ